MAEAPPGWRVVAVDQLGMGFSERCSAADVAERIDDLDAVLDALDVTGPVVTAGHDWGGAVSLGWAVRHRDRLPALVLANTAVHQPPAPPAPSLIRLARTPALRHAVCAATPMFVRATTALSRPALPAAVRDAFAAPYGSADAAAGGGGVRRGHPARAGPSQRRDPGRDRRGGPQARRRAGAAAVGAARPGVLRPLPARPAGPPAARGRPALRAGVAPRAGGRPGGGRPRVGVDQRARPGPRLRGAASGPRRCARREREVRAGAVDGAGGTCRRPLPRRREPVDGSISWDLLVRRVHELAVGLADHGVAPGDRVALLVPPGRTSPRPRTPAGGPGRRWWSPTRGWVPPGSRGPCAARTPRTSSAPFPASRWPPRWVSRAAGSRPGRCRRARSARPRLAALARRGRALLDAGVPLPPEAGPDDEAAVLFTSGATGPAKGVVYRHRQARAQLAALRGAYGITATTGSSPPSRRSRSTGPRWGSRRRCRRC